MEYVCASECVNECASQCVNECASECVSTGYASHYVLGLHVGNNGSCERRNNKLVH